MVVAKQAFIYLSVDTLHLSLSTLEHRLLASRSMHAEYVALREVVKKILEYCYFLDNCGFPQSDPTVIDEDNLSSIIFVIAPNITRKSRHIASRHHFIRDLVAQSFVVMRHLSSYLKNAGLLNKSLGPRGVATNPCVFAFCDPGVSI